MVVVIGVDVHKRSHTFVAVDEVGRQLGQLLAAATGAGHAQAVAWAASSFPGERTFGVEDCRSWTLRLERDLLDAGERVVRVPPKLMAAARRGARQPGKSDPIDALAVARAVLREPDLPVAGHDPVSWELKQLVGRRDQLVAERVQEINRLRMRLHQLDPAAEPPNGTLDQVGVQTAVGAWLAGRDGVDAEIARDILADVIALTVRIKAWTKRIKTAVRAAAPQLLDLPGVAELTAAKIVAETAGISRFRTEAAYAMHNGTAPIPASSGATSGKVRLNRGGNRQLNAALHRIAVSQVRHGGPGRDYYQRRLLLGDKKRHALRALKRQLSRVVFRLLHAPAAATESAPTAVAA